MVDKPARPPKKAETLEVRLPHETKEAFLAACRERGTTASAVVRQSIDAYLQSFRGEGASPVEKLIIMVPRPVRKPRYAVGAAGALALAVAATLPSAADPNLRAYFTRLDADRNGAITLDEFLASTGGGKTADEDRVEVRRTVATVVHHGETAGAPETPGAPGADGPHVRDEAVSYWMPAPAGSAEGTGLHMDVRQMRSVRLSGPGPAAIPSVEDLRKSEFSVYDADQDGRVSYDEFTDRHRTMLTRGFERLDQNADGALDEAEYARIANPPSLHWAAKTDGVEVPPVEIPGPAAMKPEAIAAAFRQLDRNSDRRLSLEEYLPPR